MNRLKGSLTDSADAPTHIPVEIDHRRGDTAPMAAKKKARKYTAYPPAEKARVVLRILGGKESIPEISKETGISDSLLYIWRNKAIGEMRKQKAAQKVAQKADQQTVKVRVPKLRGAVESNGAELTIQAAVPAVQAAALIQEATTKFLSSTVITTSMVREMSKTVRDALDTLVVP